MPAERKILKFYAIFRRIASDCTTVTLINEGQKIAQLVVSPVVKARFEAVNELSESERGKGGFGSTNNL
jgi:dUTPase